MGEIHDLRCEKCGYGIKTWLGIGMMYSPEMIFEGTDPSLVELVDDEQISTSALELVKTGAEINDHYGHALYACTNDFYLFNKFYFKIDEMEPEYPCPYCDNTLKRITFAKGRAGVTRLQFIDDEKFWHCPKCGNDSMNEVSFSNWD
ncbi:hypothetical protein [Companilactobacillus kimchiensis]|nr:hypothetical protein [Companilactobacillus kimchiensis]